MNKKDYLWFDIPDSDIDGYKIWISAPDQTSANETLKIMHRVKELGLTTASLTQTNSRGEKLRSFNIILN